jgi:hypothetical protein
MSYLVEAEETGPIEGEDAIVTPPRPPHRRVSVSLVFTLTVLVGTVVAIYAAFPARHHVLVSEAIDYHHNPPQAWDLAAPTAVELRAWALGVGGKEMPLPQPSATILGAAKLQLFDRGAALIRVHAGNDDVTYLVQRAHGILPDDYQTTEGDLRAVAWNKGPFACVAVGPDATAKVWLPMIRGGR